MNYINTLCFWPLSTECKTVLAAAPDFFFSQSFYIEISWKSYDWCHLLWICSCSVGDPFSSIPESSWRTPGDPRFTSSLFHLFPFWSPMIAVQYLFVFWHLPLFSLFLAMLKWSKGTITMTFELLCSTVSVFTLSWLLASWAYDYTVKST